MYNSGMSIKDKSGKRNSEESIEKVSLDAWITMKMSEDKNLKPSQRRELEVFMKKQELSPIESRKKYDEAYKRF